MEHDPLWINITEIIKNKVRYLDVLRDLVDRNEGEHISREREHKIGDNMEAIKKIPDREFLEQVIPVKASIKEAIDIFYIVNKIVKIHNNTIILDVFLFSFFIKSVR